MMKYYLGDRLLLIDMHNRATHCVVQGEDRVICCCSSLAAAEDTRMDIINHKMKILNEMKELLEKGHAYSAPKKTAHGIDLRELYPTAGLLAAGIRRMEKTIRSIRVLELRVEP